jgi:deoxyadenosine/deoxycytidine kinase
MFSYKTFFEQVTLKDKIMESIICIDGVVGAGKTTLGEILCQSLDISFFKEPVDNNPLLEKFYHNQSRYSFPMQVYFLNKRFKMLKEAAQLSGCIMDRSIYGDVIFARLLQEGGNMSQEEYDLYEELLMNMLEHAARPRLMIYLDITVENAVQRIQRRGRAYEQIVPQDYWARLNEHYTAYFNHYNFSDILRIDVNDLNFVDSEEDKKTIIRIIENHLEPQTA